MNPKQGKICFAFSRHTGWNKFVMQHGDQKQTILLSY